MWQEAWHILGPDVRAVFADGRATYKGNVLVPLEMNGRMEELYWNYSYSPLFEGDLVAGALLICQNITAAIDGQRRLQAAEALSARILQSIGDAVIVMDADTRVTRMNPVAERLTGYPLAEALGHPLAEMFQIVHETSGEAVESPGERVKRLGTIVGMAHHTVLQRRDTSEISIDDSAAPILTEGGQHGEPDL